MKRLLSFAVLLFSLAQVSFAGSEPSFTGVNKKVSGIVFTIADYQAGCPVAIMTDAQAVEAQQEFSVEPILYQKETGELRFVYADGTNAAALIITNEKTFYYAISDANYVQLYDSIVAAEQALPNLVLNNHGAWGSKYNVDAVSGDITTQIGDITNNNPYLNLEAAIKEAKDCFSDKLATTGTWGNAKSAINNAIQSEAALFENLEELRDSLALFMAFTDGTEANGETLSRKVSAYPGVESFINTAIDNAKDSYKNSGSYVDVKSTITLLSTSVQTISDLVKNYSADDLEFYDKMQSGDVAEAVSTFGYPVIPNISTAEYGLFVKVPSMQMVDAGTKFGKECAAWAGSAPFVSYSGIALAGVLFAANMTFAGQLMAENIKHMQTLQECIDWLNKECQDDHAYAFLSEEVARSRMNLRSCDNSAVAELQHGILKEALARAKELALLAEQQKLLQDLIFDAQDLFYDMETNRDNELGAPYDKFQSKTNLRKCINAAVIEKDKNYVLKTVTYDYSVNGGEYSLYDFQWYDGAKKFDDPETPSQVVAREVTKLQNGIDLFMKQYQLEQKLDEILVGMDTLYAAPKDVVNQQWQKSELFNNEVSQNKKLIADIDNELGDIDAALLDAAAKQETIQDEVDKTQEIIDEMVNNGPTDDLIKALEEALDKFNSEKDWTKVLEDIDDLIAQRTFDDQTFDDPDYYLDYMIKQAQAFYDANVTKMTPTQISAIQKALAAGKIALSEWKDSRYNDEQDSQTPLNNYDELERDYLLKRMYYAALALEYVQKMTIMENPDADTADTQLAEAIALVAISAASSYGDLTGIEQALAEANLLYRDEDSTETEKTATARKLLSLINGTTGIADVEGKAQLRDGKMIENGRLIIVKGGKKFNANGVAQ